MQHLQSALWVHRSGPGEFKGVLAWITPSAFFRLAATSRRLCDALRTPDARAFCQTVCFLTPADWVYIDDLTSVDYNGRYAQVLGLQDGSSSKGRRYGCAVYGVLGKKLYDRVVHRQNFRAVSLPVRSLYKVQADVAAVRIYADGEVRPADATQVGGHTALYDERLGEWFPADHISYVANVQIPAGLLGCMTVAQKCRLKCPSMNNTRMPLMLQEVEMVNAGDRRCFLASGLKLPTIYLKWDGGDFDRYWMDEAGPHLVFRADGADFRVKDLLFVRDFLRFAMYMGDARGSFGDVHMPSLFQEFHDEREQAALHEISHLETPTHIDEEVAATMSDIVWTEKVEKTIKAGYGVQTAQPSQPPSHFGHSAVDGAEKINLLRIGSPSKTGGGLDAFRHTLLNGKHLQRCRRDLEENGFSFVLPEQAFMVVTPAQYADVRHALKGIELHPFHLIVAEQFDYLIEEILADFPCKQRPRVKDGTSGRQELCVLPTSPQNEDDAESDMAEEDIGSAVGAEVSESSETRAPLPRFVLKRTFLCEAPVLKSNASVSCHSTTEVQIDLQQSSSHYGYSRGVNPRRFG